MAETTFETLDDLRAAVGRHLGASDWVSVTKARISDFALATGTGDDGVSAPPLLVLALTNLFLPQIVEVRGAAMGVNYGTGEVRFGPPAPVGSRVRGRADLVGCDGVRGGVQTTMRITVDVEDRDEPACVVEALSRWLQ
ncbi:MAG: dehydratase [Acidimicrobiales bacterium]